MTYDTQERSYQSGAPVELYLFARGAQVWRYTSTDSDITFDGNTWTSAVIQRSAIETTSEQARNALKLTTPRDLAVADLFRIASPSEVISLTVYRYHRGDGDSAVIWMGRVLNVQWQGSQAHMQCEPVSLSFGRTGLRRLYQASCPHVLFGTGCRLNKLGLNRECEVTAISGASITVDALDDLPWRGGTVELTVEGGNIERRFIRSFSGLVLNLSQPYQGLEVGDTVTLWPGCDHTMQTCNDVYSNIANYGGMPYIPSKNPFDGTPVY